MKMKSALLLALAFSLIGVTPSARAQAVAGAPAFVDYQGTVFDGTNTDKPLGSTGTGPYTAAPTNYTMQFRIYSAQTGGTLIYAEAQTVTVSLGQFSVRLGSGAPITGQPGPNGTPNTSIANAFLAKDRYLELTVVPTGSATGTPITPRLAFQSSPFSLVAERAKKADSVGSDTPGTVIATAGSFSGTVIATAGSTFTGAITATGASTFTGATITGGTFSGGTFSGSGAGLTGLTTAQIPNLDANKISSGILADARLSGNVANKSINNYFPSLTQFGKTEFYGTAFFNNRIGIGTTTPTAELDVMGNARVSGKFLSGRDKVITAGTPSPGTTWDIREFDCNDFASQTRGFYIRIYAQRNTAPFEVWNYEGHVTFAQSGFVNNPDDTKYRNAIIRWTTAGVVQFRFGAVVSNDNTVPTGEFTTLLSEGICNVYDFNPGSLNPPGINTIYGASTVPYLYFAFPPGMAGQVTISDN